MSCSYLNNGKRDETKKFVVFALIFQNVLAYCVALMVYQIGGLVLGEVAFGPATVVAFIVAAVILYFLFRPDPNKKHHIRQRQERLKIYMK